MRSLMFIVFSSSVLSLAANNTELLPLYSLNLIEGHSVLSCTGVSSFSNESPKIEKNVAIKFECKKGSRLKCTTQFNNKKSKALDALYMPLIQSFTDLYLSKDRMGAVKTAKKVEGGWSMTTPENGNLFVNDSMTELERDQPEKHKIPLAKMDNYLFIAARDHKMEDNKGTLHTSFTYKKTGNVYYPNLLHGDFNLTDKNHKFQTGIAITECTSKKG